MHLQTPCGIYYLSKVRVKITESASANLGFNLQWNIQIISISFLTLNFFYLFSFLLNRKKSKRCHRSDERQNFFTCGLVVDSLFSLKKKKIKCGQTECSFTSPKSLYAKVKTSCDNTEVRDKSSLEWTFLWPSCLGVWCVSLYETINY